MLQDRATIEQMKADILRRVELMSATEEEEVGDEELGIKSKTKGVDIAYEDDLDDETGVKVRDGQSEDEGSEESDSKDVMVYSF